MLDRFRHITCFVFDVDGVLTDGTILLTEDGQQLRSMNIKDGYALQLAVKRGYEVVVISGAVGNGVPTRLQKLGVNQVYMGVTDKVALFQTWLSERSLTAEQVLFMGDDLPDLGLMQEVGLSAAPADASTEILHVADYISPKAGGQGCVRDVIEKVMRLRGDWIHQPDVSAR
jgi:3-deoxy-D-manno-octulosonate 8-phosphate phosphatase (KDO 8-P phosphatase)